MEKIYTVAAGASLVGAVGRFLRMVPGTRSVALNTHPGSQSVGVLKAITSNGGQQLAIVVMGEEFPDLATDGGAYLPFQAFTNDASGRATAAAAGDVVSAYATQPAAPGSVIAAVITVEFDLVTPANPQYFVASTGNDNNQGTAAHPLATVTEALRRLTASSWSGSPTITVVDAVNEGGNPMWVFPNPPAGSNPILLQGTLVDSGLGIVAPTGGTAGTFSGAGVALPTITSAAVTVANAYKGSIFQFEPGTGRPNDGCRCMIDSNDGAGGFVLTSLLAGAPAAADPFAVLTHAGQITWTGALTMRGIVAIDSLRFNMGAALVLYGATIQETACRWMSTAACAVAINSSTWLGNAQPGLGASKTASLPFYGGQILTCGSRWDGTAGLITWGAFNSGIGLASSPVGTQNSTSFVEFYAPSIELCEFYNGTGLCRVSFQRLGAIRSSSISWSGTGCDVSIQNMVLGAMRKSATLSAGAAIEVLSGSRLLISSVSMTGTLAGSDLVRLTAGGTGHNVTNWTGANALANIPLIVDQGCFVKTASNTVTGGVGGNDVIVGTNAVTSWANINGGTAALCTDFNAASGGVATSHGCRVGP